MPKKTDDYAARLKLYEKLIATHPKIEVKGAAQRYTSLNGHMFTHLDPASSLGIRLPEGARDAFLKKTRRRCLRRTASSRTIGSQFPTPC